MTCTSELKLFSLGYHFELQSMPVENGVPLLFRHKFFYLNIGQYRLCLHLWAQIYGFLYCARICTHDLPDPGRISMRLPETVNLIKTAADRLSDACLICG